MEARYVMVKLLAVIREHTLNPSEPIAVAPPAVLSALATRAPQRERQREQVLDMPAVCKLRAAP